MKNGESVRDIVISIDEHFKKENADFVKNRAIGRGFVILNKNIDARKVWVVNRDIRSSSIIERDITGAAIGTSSSGRKDTLVEDGISISKNKVFARILLDKTLGRGSCVMEQNDITFDILNASTFIEDVSNGKVVDIAVFTSDSEFEYRFKDLIQARQKLEDAEKRLEQKEEAVKQAKDKEKDLIEKIRKETEEAEKAKEQAENEIERQKIEQRRKEEEEKERIRLERLKEETKRKEKERADYQEYISKLSDRYNKAADFVRRQASLRLNPVLSKEQNEIKFSHLYDGVATIIDGGPGTGKTTTLIQRLKLLITKDDLEDQRMNFGNVKLSNEQYDVISKSDGDWIFFSPTELLRKYLQKNMEFEGLGAVRIKTQVWNNYLRAILRDNYKLAGDEAPFEFDKSLSDTILITKTNQLKVVKQFTSFYLEDVKKAFSKISTHRISGFSYERVGKVILTKCESIKDVDTIKSLIKQLLELERLRDNTEIKDLRNRYETKIKEIVDSYLAETKKDEAIFNQLMEKVAAMAKHSKVQDDEVIGEEITEEVSLDDRNNELRLYNRLRVLFGNLALMTIDDKRSLSQEYSELNALISENLNEERKITLEKELSNIGELAYFNTYFYPYVRDMESILLSRIPRVYKAFRRKALNRKSNGWNRKILEKVVNGNKNMTIHPQEQALLLGFINNIVLTIYGVSKSRFELLKHNYSNGYKSSCHPVIGVDEATDYCILDYYAIASLRHYLVSSFTLTGDVMQCLKPNGITDWNTLKSRLIFPKLEVGELNVSYRQSAELLKLAQSMYFKKTGEMPSYICKMKDIQDVPKPLWFVNDSEEKKAEWIVKRILDVKRAYGFVPSIAIFVSDKSQAATLLENIKEIGSLEKAGIDVMDCSDDRLTDEDTIRIFPIDKVKGMEFEVVFYHNIDDIEEMIDRYLYVGLSRATFYLGITSRIVNNQQLVELKDLFESNGNWETIV